MKPKTKKILKRAGWLIRLALFSVLSVLWFANWKIPHDTADFVFDEVKEVPEQKVALVLGAAKNIGSQPNSYFVYRIRAAKELYEAGKVKAFVVSGDNSRKDYDEANDMRHALIEAGVPDSLIYLDYAGFRTLDSVVRMQKIFGQNSFIIVSQQFHNERAVFLAQHFGLTAYGYNAQDLSLNRFSYRTKAREKLARVKVFIDLILSKQPRFLGEQVEIKI